MLPATTTFKVILLNPGYVPSYSAIAECQAMLGNYEVAAEDFTRLISINNQVFPFPFFPKRQLFPLPSFSQIKPILIFSHSLFALFYSR